VTQLHDLTALEQAAAVRSGEVSPTQLVEHSLARIEALDPALGAFITVTPERALAAAADAEARLRDGGEPPRGQPGGARRTRARADRTPR
jgi:amidase